MNFSMIAITFFSAIFTAFAIPTNTYNEKWDSSQSSEKVSLWFFLISY